MSLPRLFHLSLFQPIRTHHQFPADTLLFLDRTSAAISIRLRDPYSLHLPVHFSIIAFSISLYLSLCFPRFSFSYIFLSFPPSSARIINLARRQLTIKTINLCSLLFYRNSFIVKLIWSCKNLCSEDIQNHGRTKRVLLAGGKVHQIHFWRLKKENHMEFTKGCILSREKFVLVKKIESFQMSIVL